MMFEMQRKSLSAFADRCRAVLPFFVLIAYGARWDITDFITTMGLL